MPAVTMAETSSLGDFFIAAEHRESARGTDVNDQALVGDVGEGHEEEDVHTPLGVPLGIGQGDELLRRRRRCPDKDLKHAVVNTATEPVTPLWLRLGCRLVLPKPPLVLAQDVTKDASERTAKCCRVQTNRKRVDDCPVLGREGLMTWLEASLFKGHGKEETNDQTYVVPPGPWDGP